MTSPTCLSQYQWKGGSARTNFGLEKLLLLTVCEHRGSEICATERARTHFVGNLRQTFHSMVWMLLVKWRKNEESGNVIGSYDRGTYHARGKARRLDVQDAEQGQRMVLET